MNAITSPLDAVMRCLLRLIFLKGVRGKFYHSDATLNLPVYLNGDVQAYLAAIAAKKGMPLSELANDLLRREIGIIEAVK